MNPEKFSCIRQVVKTVKIPLWDMYTTTEYKGIEAALDKWKRQYEKQVGGIVVNYKNVSVPSRLGFHSDRGSYAIYNVRATFDIFCPKVGEIVKGKINRVSSEHIGCLIAESINVSIRLPRDSPCGLSKYIYLDREILFEIRSFSCKPRALCVNGEITDKCIELMDEYYPVTDEFSAYEPGSQAVFGDVPSDGDQQVDLSILGSATDSKKKGKKRGREETDSPKVKKIKKDLDSTNNIEITQEEDSSATDTPKKVKKKKSSTDSPKVKKSKRDMNSITSLEATLGDGDKSSTDTSSKKTKSNSKYSPKVKKIQHLQGESSTSKDTPKKAKRKKSNSTDSPKVSQEDYSSSTESSKKEKKKISNSTDSSHDSDSSSTESDKKDEKKLVNSTDTPKKAKKKSSKSTDSPKKVKKELSSTEDEASKKKIKKKQKKNKDSSKPKEKKKSSKKKGKITASGDILKKDKKKPKKSSKKDNKSKSSKKSKKNNKKDKSDQRKSKKIKLSNDSDVDVHLKEIKSEEM